MPPRWLTLRDAWQAALYGPAGFYLRREPAAHFRTSPEASTMFATAVAALARRHGLNRVVDVGAGSGRLVADLAAADPSLDLVGVEIRPRPPGLPSTVQWLSALPPTGSALVIANELLDNIPCDVVELDDRGAYRLIEVDMESGQERWGPPTSREASAWLARWWPLSRPGERAEVGLARDTRWAELCAGVHAGLCVAVDYGHRAAARPAGGTLASYRDGQQASVRFDGSRDVTAHVAFDSLAAAVGGTLRRQREVLTDLGLDGRRPPLSLATEDPRGYLKALARAGEAAELTARGGLGDFYWLMTERD